MGQEPEQEPISKKRVLYRVPGMEGVSVRRDVVYGAADEASLAMDIYYPSWASGEARIPAVVIVAGFPDPGFEAKVGCKFKEMGSSVSWGELMAASGLAAITYSNRNPSADIYSLLETVRRSAASLRIDEHRIGLWASSGNVPLALSVLIGEGSEYLKCAVLCYGYMLGVAESAKMWGFANPAEGKGVADLPQDLPLFIARAGQDQMPSLNDSLDRFVSEALAHNLPLTFVNHPTGPHAFDLLDDSETSRAIIRQILAFMRFHLSAEGG
jgi:hypothetical protein